MKSYEKREKKNKHTRRITVVALLAVLAILGSFLFVLAGQGNRRQVLGDSLGSSDTELGESEVEEAEENMPLFFQFQKKEDDQLTLALLGDVGEVIMIAPSEKQESVEIPDALPLGASLSEKVADPRVGAFLAQLEKSEEIVTGEADVSPNRMLRSGVAALGSSGLENLKGPIEVNGDDFLAVATPVTFQLKGEGEYFFDVYNTDNKKIARIPFANDELAPGELSLVITDDGSDGNKLDVASVTSYRLRYKPLNNGQKEELHLYLPAGFNLNGNPLSGENMTYTYAELKYGDYYDFDAFYTGVPNSATYIDSKKAAVAGSKVRGKNYKAVITIAGNIESEIIFSYNISPEANEINLLSQIMVDYGVDGDKVPLLTLVKEYSAGALRKEEKHIGYSGIRNTTPGFDIRSRTYAAITQYVYSMEDVYLVHNAQNDTITYPHYPISEVYLYTKVLEGQYFLGGIEPAKVKIDGEWYHANLKTSSEFQRFKATYDTSTQTWNPTAIWYIAKETTVVPEKDYDMGSMYISYVQLGQPSGYLKLLDFTEVAQTHKYDKDLVQTAMFPNHSDGKYPTSLPDYVRRQGRQDTLRLTLDNTSQNKSEKNNVNRSNAIALVYEKATASIKFPEETWMTSFVFEAGSELARPTKVPKPSKLTAVTADGTRKDVTALAVSDGAGTYTVTIPPEYGKVHQVELYYDVLSANVYTYIYANVEHAVLPTSPVAVQAELEFKTESGTGVAQHGSNPTPVTIPTYYKKPQNYTLVHTDVDGLKFGTLNYRYSYNGLQPYTHSTLRLPSYQPVVYPISYEKQVGGVKVFDWRVVLKTVSDGGKAYENVNIDFTPVTENDKKLLSKLRGFRFLGGVNQVSNVVEGGKIFYTTNLNSERSIELKATNTHDEAYLTATQIPDGEYITSMRIHFDKLLTEKMKTDAKYVTEDAGEILVGANSTGPIIIAPMFESSNYYYKGTAGQELAKETDEFKLKAVITTDSTAKYVNSGDVGANNTSTGVIGIRPYNNYTITPVDSTGTATSSSTQWNSAWYALNNGVATGSPINTMYQGSYQRLLVSRFINAIREPESGTSVAPHYFFGDVERDIYLEVNDAVDILSIRNHSLVSKRSLGTGYSLYHYHGRADATIDANKDYLYIDIYVRPDAPIVDKLLVIKSMGVSFDDFANNMLSPDSGNNVYYTKEPFLKTTLGERSSGSAAGNPSFPAEWNVTANNQYYYDLATRTNAKIEMFSANQMLLQPMVNGGLFNEIASINELQTEQLAARAWIMNGNKSGIPNYSAHFELPREGTQSRGPDVSGAATYYDNKFSAYLSGPVTTTIAVPHTVTYYGSNGSVLNTSGFTTKEDWKAVWKLDVKLNEQFPGDKIYEILMPLYTDRIKVGAEIADLITYVSGYTIADYPGVSTSTVYVPGAGFNFKSYELSLKADLDLYETGEIRRYPGAAKSVAQVLLYYDDGSGHEELLYDSATLGYPINNTLRFNADVSRLRIKPINAETHMLTISKAAGILEAYNSDIPRDNPALSEAQQGVYIDMDDVRNNRINLYDAALIRIPKMKSADAVLSAGESKSVLPSIEFDMLLGTPVYAPPIGYYQFTATGANNAIATATYIGQQSTYVSKVTVDGVDDGTTTYEHKVTNRLGDVFTKNSNITVAPKTVANANLNKRFVAGANPTAGDSFKFNIWSEANMSDLITHTVQANGTQNLNNFFLYGKTYYIQEAEIPLGYDFDWFEIVGNGTPIMLTPASGSYSFVIPAGVTTLEINAFNSTPRYNMTVEKLLLPDNGNHNWQDEFTIKIIESSTNTTIFGKDLKAKETPEAITGFIMGAEYIVDENVPAGYELVTVEIVDAVHGFPFGPQPTVQPNGSYKFTFDNTHINSRILVKNQPMSQGTLELVSVPNLDYGSSQIGVNQMLKRTADVSYTVRDSRLLYGQWKLSVKATDLTLKTNPSYKLPYKPLYFSPDGVVRYPIADNSIEIDNGFTIGGQELQTKTWLQTDDTGILLQAEDAVVVAGDYEANVTWTLEETP